jgi:hypothetical protein
MLLVRLGCPRRRRSLSTKLARCSGKLPAAASASECLSWAMEDDNNGHGLPFPTWSTWHLVCCWDMAVRLTTHPFPDTNSSQRRHVEMLSQHPPKVSTICSYNPCLPESRSICMFPSRWVEMGTMHGEVYIGGLPCVTNAHLYHFVAFLCI